MNNRIVPVKNQIAPVFIAGAAAIVAVPIVIFCLIRLAWQLATAWTAPRAPMIAKKIKLLVAIAEAHISGQKDNS